MQDMKNSAYTKIANFIPLSLSDYKGHCSSIVFLSGCNYRCPTCHNFHLRDDNVDQYLDFDLLLSYIRNNIHIANSLTISGGEPTIHKDLPIFINDIKRHFGNNYKIKLDSNGSNPDMVIDLLEKGLIDNASIDIKAPYDLYYKAINGSKHYDFSEWIKTRMEKLLNYSISHLDKIEYRTTKVPFLTEENIKTIKCYLPDSLELIEQEYIPREGSDILLGKNRGFRPENIFIDESDFIEKGM